MPKLKTPNPPPQQWTPNGYDPKWIEAINGVMEDRDVDARITDLTDDLWNRFIGPLCDAIEDGEYHDNQNTNHQTD